MSSALQATHRSATPCGKEAAVGGKRALLSATASWHKLCGSLGMQHHVNYFIQGGERIRVTAQLPNKKDRSAAILKGQVSCQTPHRIVL